MNDINESILVVTVAQVQSLMYPTVAIHTDLVARTIVSLEKTRVAHLESQP